MPGLGTETPTTVEQVLSRLPSGQPEARSGLFNGGMCGVSPRRQRRPRRWPDLRTIGDRDDADSLIRSILTPNQIIVEGYGLLTVSTRDGKGFAGIFESESDRTLNMVQLNGEAAAIDKSTIVSRRNIHQSPMPAFDRVLNPQDLADLAAWLMTQRGVPVGGAAPIPTGTSLQARGNTGFAELKPDRLSIVHAGRPLDRLCLQRSPGASTPFPEPPDTQRSAGDRTHPPGDGDATDHATMHPGVWLAFGDINGEDFWRNKARIEHVAFTAEPAVAEGRLTFATENRLIAQDGMPLATQRSRFALPCTGNMPTC